jgi:hypothetical protein
MSAKHDLAKHFGLNPDNMSKAELNNKLRKKLIEAGIAKPTGQYVVTGFNQTKPQVIMKMISDLGLSIKPLVRLDKNRLNKITRGSNADTEFVVRNIVQDM